MKRLSMAVNEEASLLVLDDFLPYLTNRLAQKMSQELAAKYQARFGITIAEWRVLAHLSQHRNVSVREIHERVAMDKSKISRAAARLEDAGLIEKDISAVDRRLVELRLTAKGRGLFAELVPLALSYEAEVCRNVPEKELAAFLRTLRKLLTAKSSS